MGKYPRPEPAGPPPPDPADPLRGTIDELTEVHARRAAWAGKPLVCLAMSTHRGGGGDHWRTPGGGMADEDE